MAVTSNPIAAGWLNENSLREYPFREGSGLRPVDDAGAVVENGWSLPNCLVVDMSVTIAGSNPDPFLYLGQMSVVDGTVTLAFCNSDGERVISVYATSSSEKNGSYQVSGTGSYVDARGVITLGDLESFFEQTPDGVYTFTSDETQIEPTCIRFSTVGVRSLRAVDSDGYASLLLTGDVSLVAGSNIRFDYRPDENALVVSADPNAGYADDCDCDEANTKYVRSINGIQVADVQIVGDDCIKVTTENGVITMSDECAKPCCGCAETTFINQTINNLQTSVNTLTGNVSSLGARLEQFVTSYVLSRKTLT